VISSLIILDHLIRFDGGQEVMKYEHLHLKRFKDSEVTLGCLKARKALPYDAVVAPATTGRSRCVFRSPNNTWILRTWAAPLMSGSFSARSCVKCGKGIAKGELRFTLMLQCHKGWKVRFATTALSTLQSRSPQ